MTVELDREDLLMLVKGASNKIGYELMDYLSPYGSLAGAPNERWYWNDSALNALTEEGLLHIYKKIKNQ
jgi:hypothetical protein